MEQCFWSQEHGLYADEATGNWKTLFPYRGQNANMHGCEALIAAFEATGEFRCSTLSDAFPRFCENLSREVLVVDSSCEDYCANHSGVHVNRVSPCRSTQALFETSREDNPHKLIFFEIFSSPEAHKFHLEQGLALP